MGSRLLTIIIGKKTLKKVPLVPGLFTTAREPSPNGALVINLLVVYTTGYCLRDTVIKLSVPPPRTNVLSDSNLE